MGGKLAQFVKWIAIGAAAGAAAGALWGPSYAVAGAGLGAAGGLGIAVGLRARPNLTAGQRTRRRNR